MIPIVASSSVTPRASAPITGSSRWSLCWPRCQAWRCLSALFWLSNFFGGGTWTRILHPVIGLIMLLAFVFLAASVWKDNRLQDRDWKWLRQMKDVVNNRDESSPEVGRYNAAQKLLFYVIVVCLVGFSCRTRHLARVFREVFFRRGDSPGGGRACGERICADLRNHRAHLCRDLGEGSVEAMTRGTVTPGWAWKHHRAWFRQITK